jgi:glycine cleavage system H protein
MTKTDHKSEPDNQLQKAITMDGFSYVNLFDTKGIEYIIIIAFLLAIIPFWKLLNRPLKVAAGKESESQPLFASVLSAPQGLYFSKNHTWAHMLRSGDARIGIDRLLLNLTGEVELRMLKDRGSLVRKGEELYEIARDGKRLTIASPLSGRVTSLNSDLRDDPALLHEDPYGKGWICSIRPENWLTEVTGFHFADGANAWLKNELARIRDFMAAAAGRFNPEAQAVYMQDGGEPADFPLASMPAEVWNDFQNEFLK